MNYSSEDKKINFIPTRERIEELWHEIPAVKKRDRKKRLKKFLKFLAYFLVIIFLILVVVTGTILLDFKNYFTLALEGKSQLEQSLVEAEQSNFSQARFLAASAENNFSLVTQKLEDLQKNPLFNSFPGVSEQLVNYYHLSQTTLFLSSFLKRGTGLGEEAQVIAGSKDFLNFNDLDSAQKEQLIALLYESLAEIKGMEANLGLAVLSLERVDLDLPLFPFKSEIKKIKEQLIQGEEKLNNFTKVAVLIPQLAGYPKETNFLVFFQNSDELRPTGGFLGTYGILTTKNGEIERFDTHDIYHMDMPLEGVLKIEPPEPIKQYLNSTWYMRDGNWSPDWPTSAQKLEWFFYTEEKLLTPKNQINDFSGQFNGVLAITPEFVTSLMAITGPIKVHDREYTQENLVDILQYQVQRGYEEEGISSWERKEVVGEILQVLKLELFELSPDDWSRVITVIQDSLLRKNILFYFSNDYYQDLVQEFDWAGQIKDTPGDYLMLVDSNMGALKTDSVMERGLEYSLEETSDSWLVNLRIKYSHHGEPSWRVSEYKSYTRILVPAGSELLAVKKNNLGPSQEVKIDTTLVKDKLSWGTFLTLAPGQMGSLELKYRLPDQLGQEFKRTKQYNLLIQKQPGTVLKDSLIDISLLNEIESYNPPNLYTVLTDRQSLEWRSDIIGDRELEIIAN